MKKILVTSVFIIGFAAYVLYGNTSTQADSAPATSLTVTDQSVPQTTGNTPQPSTSAPVSVPVTAGQAPAPTQTTPTPTPAPVATPTGKYKNGTYTGPAANAYYGNIQVRATISGGRLTDVVFLQYPNDRNTSRFINQQAMPTLKAEAIQAQSANVDGVSGASDSSAAFKESLGAALAAAKA